jgi:hypothetical protein
MLTMFSLMTLSLAACMETDGGKGATPLDATYWIDGISYDLKDGKNSSEIDPESETTTTTAVYGPFATGDLDGDNVADTGVILVQDPGGSGTFYYAAAAINKNGKYEGAHAFFLGDRIVPVTIEIQDSVMKVKYRDRQADNDMAQGVSVDKTVQLVLKNGRLERAERETLMVDPA